MSEFEPFIVTLSHEAEKIRKIVEPLIELQGYTLINLRVGGDKRGRSVTLFVDSKGEAPMNLDALGKLSRFLGDNLDVEDGEQELFDSRYNLEVSSPGIERSLSKRSHFDAQVGNKIKVKAEQSGKIKNITGMLQNLTDDGFEIEIGSDEPLNFLWADLLSARTTFEFPGSAREDAIRG